MVSQEPAKLSWAQVQSGFESRQFRQWKGRIVVECIGPENRRSARVQGFESLSFLQSDEVYSIRIVYMELPPRFTLS